MEIELWYDVQMKTGLFWKFYTIVSELCQVWKCCLTKERFFQWVTGTFYKQQQILSHKSALSVLIWKWSSLIWLQVARKFPLRTLESQKISIFHLLHSKLSTLYLGKYAQSDYFVLCGVHDKSANLCSVGISIIFDYWYLLLLLLWILIILLLLIIFDSRNMFHYDENWYSYLCNTSLKRWCPIWKVKFV